MWRKPEQVVRNLFFDSVGSASWIYWIDPQPSPSIITRPPLFGTLYWQFFSPVFGRWSRGSYGSPWPLGSQGYQGHLQRTCFKRPNFLNRGFIDCSQVLVCLVFSILLKEQMAGRFICHYGWLLAHLSEMFSKNVGRFFTEQLSEQQLFEAHEKSAEAEVPLNNCLQNSCISGDPGDLRTQNSTVCGDPGDPAPPKKPYSWDPGGPQKEISSLEILETS